MSSMGKKDCSNPNASNSTRQSYSIRKNGKHDTYMNTHISDGKHHNLLILYTNVDSLLNKLNELCFLFEPLNPKCDIIYI